MTKLVLKNRYSKTIGLETNATTVSIDAGSERPIFPFDDQSITTIDAIDVIEHVADEEAWILECARVLIPGGSIRIQVPRHGATSWFESLNIYRYSVDVLGRGHEPRETKLVGWHRQYSERDLRELLTKFDFAIQSIRSHSIGIAEIPSLVRLVVGDMIRNDRSTGKRVMESRVDLDRFDSRFPAGPLSRRLLVTATSRTT